MQPGVNSSETDRLLQRVAQGESRAYAQLMARQRDYLRRLLEARMEPALHQRVDPSDIIQETMLEADRRMHDYLTRRPTSFRLWLRRKALEQLVNARRHHFALKRSVDREMQLTNASSMAIAKSLVSDRGSKALQRKEEAALVHDALLQLSDADCEILVLRHVEQLSNAEVAQLLEIDPKTASKRYGRAVFRLAEKLKSRDESGS